MSNSFFKPNRLWLGRCQRVVMRLSLAMVACFIAFSTVQAQSTVTFKGQPVGILAESWPR